MPLEPEALQTRLLLELSSMPDSVSRVAVDALYTAFALRRSEYPSIGIYVVDEVILACAPFWLNADFDGLFVIRSASTLYLKSPIGLIGWKGRHSKPSS